MSKKNLVEGLYEVLAPGLTFKIQEPVKLAVTRQNRDFCKIWNAARAASASVGV